MYIEEKQVFNLMDTNGRRSDVLNAFNIYLQTLQEIKDDYPSEKWSNYPKSIAQFLFYTKAVEKSKDVFKKHGKFDEFINTLEDDYTAFIEKDSSWIENNLSDVAKVLDESIEKRARHYTSNLVKIGFTDSKRNISNAGYDYLNGTIKRDPIETFLPLNEINIILIRQLLKLKIFTKEVDGKRFYYSPFFMALHMLLNVANIDKNTFSIIETQNPEKSRQKAAGCRNTQEVIYTQPLFITPFCLLKGCRSDRLDINIPVVPKAARRDGFTRQYLRFLKRPGDDSPTFIVSSIAFLQSRWHHGIRGQVHKDLATIDDLVVAHSVVLLNRW